MAGLGVLGTIALLGLAACPADLANPADYDHPGSLTPAAAAGAPAVANQPGLKVNTDCLTALFASSCTSAGCHSAGANAAAGLDLASTNVNTRLIDIVATFATASPNTGCMAGLKLIDSTNPDTSWLLGKLTTDGTSCGLTMPIGAAASAADIACVKTYAENVAAAKASGM